MDLTLVCTPPRAPRKRPAPHAAPEPRESRCDSLGGHRLLHVLLQLGQRLRKRQQQLAADYEGHGVRQHCRWWYPQGGGDEGRAGERQGWGNAAASRSSRAAVRGATTPTAQLSWPAARAPWSTKRVHCVGLPAATAASSAALYCGSCSRASPPPAAISSRSIPAAAAAAFKRLFAGFLLRAGEPVGSNRQAGGGGGGGGSGGERRTEQEGALGMATRLDCLHPSQKH